MSVLTLTAISIDRYYAICYPLRFKSNLSRAKQIIVLIWLVSLATMAPNLIYLRAKPSEELSEAGLQTVLYSDCNYDWSHQCSRYFQFVKTILLYLVPFMLMFAAHFRILQALKIATTLEASSSTCRLSNRGQQQRQSSASANDGSQQSPVQEAGDGQLVLSPSPAQQQRRPDLSLEGIHAIDELSCALGQQQEAGPRPAHLAKSAASSSSPSSGRQDANAAASMNNNKVSEFSAPADECRAGNVIGPSGAVAAAAADFVDRTPGGSSNGLCSARRLAPRPRPRRQPATMAVAARVGLANLRRLMGVGVANQSTTNNKQQRQRKRHSADTELLQELARGRVAMENGTANSSLSVLDSATCAGRTTTTTRRQVRETSLVDTTATATATATKAHQQPTVGRLARRPTWAAPLASCSTGPTAAAADKQRQLTVTMHNRSKLESRRAAAKMLMTIVVLFGICYLPVHLINSLR